MKHLSDLSDDDIDALLLLLFSGENPGHRQRRHHEPAPTVQSPPKDIRDLSHDALLRIRSRNHPDKYPHVNQAAYQAAVEELDRRRRGG